MQGRREVEPPDLFWQLFLRKPKVLASGLDDSGQKPYDMQSRLVGGENPGEHEQRAAALETSQPTV